MPLTKIDTVPALIVIDLQKFLFAMPRVHPAGEIWWNPLLVMWIQPMLVNNQPVSSQNLSPGPFVIDRLPAISGPATCPTVPAVNSNVFADAISSMSTIRTAAAGAAGLWAGAGACVMVAGRARRPVQRRPAGART